MEGRVGGRDGTKTEERSERSWEARTGRKGRKEGKEARTHGRNMRRLTGSRQMP